jgi:hypothetical protein
MNIIRKVLLLLAFLALNVTLQAAVTFRVDPSTVADNFSGNLTLSFTGLDTGATVVLQKYLDVNANGVVDDADWLVQQLQLTDGQASSVGGITNYNVVADTDSTPGTITANWSFRGSGFEHRCAGQYLFVASIAGISTTAVLTITNASLAQSVSGVVKSNGTNVPHAAVILSNGRFGSSSFVAGAISDNSGHYVVGANPGNYNVVPIKPGFVTDSFAAPVVNLTPSASLSSDVQLLTGAQTITGSFNDAALFGQGLGGLLVPCVSPTGLLAFGFTDTDGNYSIPVTANPWTIGWESAELQALGYVELQNRPSVDTTVNNATGVTVSFPRGKSLIYGNLKDEQNNPLPGVRFFADDSSGLYEGLGITDANGNYVAAATPGTWYVSPDRSDASLANYIVTLGTNATVTFGQAVLRNFAALLATNHISGFLLDISNNPVANVGIYGSNTVNGVRYAQYVDTAPDGSYSFSVANGIWTVGVSCTGSGDALQTVNYQCLSDVSIQVAGADIQTNFIVTPCGPLTIATAPQLSSGTIGLYYEAILQAGACHQPFVWALAPGSQALPAGINITPDGTVSGYPTVSGTFNFTARVSDSVGGHADQPLTLMILAAPLHVATVVLSNGIPNLNYSLPLSAAGGQPPYQWSLSPDFNDMPPGLSLSPSGVISGVPTQMGTYFFDVEVTDTLNAIDTASFSLLITNGPADALILSSPAISSAGNFLFQAQAQVGVNYTVELSTDLKTWSPVQVTNAPDPSFLVVVSRGTNATGYYRLRIGP